MLNNEKVKRIWVFDHKAAFMQRVRHETGLRVRVLVGEEEARLAFRSALAHFELGRGRAVVMDISVHFAGRLRILG